MAATTTAAAIPATEKKTTVTGSTAGLIQSLRYYGPKQLKVEYVPPLECKSDEVRLKIGYCGICGSDVHEYLGGPIFPPKAGEKHPYTGAQLPITLGHEFSGTVVEVGKNVKGFSVGQKVAVIPALDDRHYGEPPCFACRKDKRNLCQRGAIYGLNTLGGGLASEIVVHSASCISLPGTVSLKAGALVEPLSVAWHCIRLSAIEKGQKAVIFGAGPIGLALLMLLKARGVSLVIISEVTDLRMQQARKFGADHVVNPLAQIEQTGGTPSKDPVTALVHKLTDGQGVDVSFDATGLQSTLDAAIASTRVGGTIFNVAIHEKPLQINLNDLSLTEKTLMGGICYTREDFDAVIALLSDKSIPAEEMITSIVPLSKAIEGGFLELINNKATHVKILIQPDE
ncbi:alcohol dehydrogenase, zinc-containing [Talaromyces stipitatus ATCC 10500]|uniref:Alcohol dehydrogenase, zinc-containing n=1 Tax=Talaromyces stipitatus (strain ATCC 10500 / CBS 375.48 / QM 6759 / NRRL 1006) TaxID=441959 RepID=B8MHF5_TALSN|nr:alcohol dehydrogenase, zinc-containing [Talaromyces stipitatus ATCC 10500]EED17134.1 alcohol dehydrogenase, zinc-containing [Talaromyces stipitatus ATCC 10500]